MTRRSPIHRALLVVLAFGPPAILFGPALSGRKVPSFRDQSDFFYPMRRYTATRLAHGELPLWNALSGNGESWVASGQSEIFYPPALVFLLANGALAAGLFLTLHAGISFLGFDLFLRTEGLSPPAAAVGALVFSCSAGAISFSTYWNHFAAMTWFGALAAAASLGLRTRRQRAAYAASLSAMILAGSPETTLLALLGTASLFWIARREEIARQRLDGEGIPRSLGSLATAMAAGLALGAVALVPFAEGLRRYAPRSSVEGGRFAFRAQMGSTIVPPSRAALPWYPSGGGYLQSLYLGAPLVALAFAGVYFRRRTVRARVWMAFAVAGIAAALLPEGSVARYPSKYLALLLVALAALAAEGIDALGSGRDAAGKRWIPAILVAAAGMFGLFLPATRFEGATALCLAMTIAGLMFLPLKILPAAGWGAAILTAAHLTSATTPLVRFANLASFEAPPKPAKGKVLTSPDELLADWASAVLPDEDRRVRRQIDALSGYANLPFGIEKARSGSALPSREEEMFAAILERKGSLIPPAVLAGCGEVRFPGGRDIARVLVPGPLAGASFFTSEEVVPDSYRALARAVAEAAGHEGRLMVDRPGGVAGGAPRVAVASLVASRPERLDYRITVSDRAWLYRPQTWDPWWAASIDGRKAPIVRANGIFSAVLVPAGSHRVTWDYRPWPFYAGTGVSLIGMTWIALQLRDRWRR